MESHGQEESLTRRLRLLIQDYPDGLAIPKELIQNADDAGATEVKFLYDERENVDHLDGLLDTGMRECQGAALWVYNNAIFTKADLENISQLSGLGFHVVYNVTDVPSFITNESVVFLDPHRSHLGKAKISQSDTGLKINICTNNRRSAYIRRKYYNQFHPYNGVFGCQVVKDAQQVPFKGTLFRLPLRKSGAKSEISNVPYTKDDVTELFQLIIDHASNLLLFTQNVKSIELYHLPGNVSDPSKSDRIFQMETKTDRILKPLSLPSTVGITNQSLLAMASSLVSNRNYALPQDISRTSTVVADLKFESSGGLTLNGQNKKVLWLVHDCIGTNESMAHARENDETSYVPVAGVAIQLENQDRKYQPILFEGGTGPLFCHLPLPSSVRSGLPVIVNGNFAIKPDRRHIVQITSDDKVNNPMDAWNEKLKTDAITLAYIGALDQMKEVFAPHPDFYSLWPDRSIVDRGFESFLLSFYTSLATAKYGLSPKIFTNGDVWVDFEHVVFLDDAFAHSDVRDIALEVLQQYLDKQHPLHDSRRVASILPQHLKAGFADSVRSKIFSLTKTYAEAILSYLKQIEGEKRNRLLLFALKHAKSNPELRALLMANACIPVQPTGTKFVKPRELVSPVGRRAGLYEVNDNVFPVACFCEQKYLDILKDLGMNVDDLSWDMIIERASSIKRKEQMERLKHWVSYVDQKLQRGNDSTPTPTQTRQLQTIRFLPVLPKPDQYPVPWKGAGHQGLVAASEAYPRHYQNLVGSACLIVDEMTCGLSYTPRSNKIRQVLGLADRNLQVDDVLIQLQGLSEVRISRENTNVVNEICQQVYAHLESCCNDDAVAALIGNRLKGSKCLLTDDVFIDPKHCAKQGANIPKFLHVVQYPLTCHQRLLSALGVKDQFHGTDFVEALHRIGFVDGITVARDAAEALQMWLPRNNCTQAEVERQCGKPILLPTEENADGYWELLPVSDLCLNAHDDAPGPSGAPRPWLRRTVEEQNIRYVHPRIPARVAQALGVRTDRQNVLSRLGAPHSLPFGQNEPLTTWIKGILKNYPCNEGVLKELLQNADDAGATELRFILDKRQHSGDRVFNENWRHLQGPALCVYNNRPFSKKDLKGICSLGEGSKSTDPTKTGQYGIGFNSVYHLTDVPSFLTDGHEIGRTLAVLDPSCKYAPDASPQSPGRCFQGDDLQTVQENFRDVFTGYLEDRFDLRGATIFRLPLRSGPMADISEIRQNVVDVRSTEALLEVFKRELFKNLLFVNSVRTISLESLGGIPMSPYTVNVSVSDRDSKALDDFNAYVKSMSEDLQNGTKTLQEIQYRDVTYTLAMKDSQGREQVWSVCECIGLPKGCAVPPKVTQAVASNDLALLPRGGAAHLLSSTQPVEGRQIFCFLPLPAREDTQLPIHINGHFALDKARRALWGDSKQNPGYRSMWNSLMMKIISQAYISLVDRECSKLQAKADVTTDELQQFYRLFPDLSKVTSAYLRELIEAFYTSERFLNKLSDLVEECVDEGSLVSRPKKDGDEADNSFTDLIQNDDFRSGLQRLLHHDASIQENVADFDENWSLLLNHLMEIEFHYVEKIVTFLKFKNGDVIPGTESKHGKLHVQIGARCRVYIVRDTSSREGGRYMAGMSEIPKYAQLLEHIVRKCFPSVSKETANIIECLLSIPMHEISGYLDKQDIMVYRGTFHRMAPELGSFIPLSKHCLLTPDFLQFFPGEFIGFELDDPLNHGQEGQATYIYAKVVEVCPHDETKKIPHRQYVIDIGGGRKVTVFSSSMYKLPGTLEGTSY